MPRILQFNNAEFSVNGNWVPNVYGIAAEDGVELRDGINVLYRRASLPVLVLADDKNQTEYDVLSAPFMPLIGHYIHGMYVIGHNAIERRDGSLLWDCILHLDSRFREVTQQEIAEGWPTWEWDYEFEDEELTQDQITGAPIENTVCERIGLEHPISILTLTITRVEAIDNTANDNLYYGNRTNSQPFWGAPPGAAYMPGIRSRERVINGVRYRQCSYTIKFKVKKPSQDVPTDINPQGQLYPIASYSWRARPLNQGTRYIDDQDNPLEIGCDATLMKSFFTDDDPPQPTTGNLDESGFALDPEDELVFLSFNRFMEADFNELNLGPDNFANPPRAY